MRYGVLRLATLALLAMAVSPAYAQVQTGSIFVRASDEQGGVMPGATITISSPVIIAGQMVGTTMKQVPIVFRRCCPVSTRSG